MQRINNTIEIRRITNSHCLFIEKESLRSKTWQTLSSSLSLITFRRFKETQPHNQELINQTTNDTEIIVLCYLLLPLSQTIDVKTDSNDEPSTVETTEWSES